MTLGEKQREFPRLISVFIAHVYSKDGYTLTFGDAYRSPEQAALNAASGKGIKNSLHRIRLAVDFNLFIHGVYTVNPKDYVELGEIWEALSHGDIKCCWGGRFSDYGHFSIAHGDVK